MMGFRAACVHVLLDETADASNIDSTLLRHCFDIGAVDLFRVMMSCHLAVWRAGEAWPRSEHPGSLLPPMLRGKSPCLRAESATGRPEDLDIGADSEAFVELWFLVLVLCISKVMP